MGDTWSIEELRSYWDLKNKETQRKARHVRAVEMALRDPATMDEHALQVACVELFHDKYQRYEMLLFSIPNGGYRSKRTAANMKAEGEKAGVPDLQLAMACKGYHGLFIEMKRARRNRHGELVMAGRLSDYQKAMIGRLQEQGYKVEVCWSVEMFDAIMREYINI